MTSRLKLKLRRDAQWPNLAGLCQKSFQICIRAKEHLRPELPARVPKVTRGMTDTINPAAQKVSIECNTYSVLLKTAHTQIWMRTCEGASKDNDDATSCAELRQGGACRLLGPRLRPGLNLLLKSLLHIVLTAYLRCGSDSVLPDRLLSRSIASSLPCACCHCVSHTKTYGSTPYTQPSPNERTSTA